MTAIYWFCSDEQYQPEELVEHAIAAEKAGFDGIMISEHFHPWVADKSASGFAFTTLGAIAARTEKIRMMTAVTAPLFRFHPAVVAQAAATIDRLSGGRFELGIGTGENINEGPLGFMLPPYKERQERIAEAYQIISRLLDGEKLDFDGKYYQTKAAKLYSPPLHKIPIILAAGGPQTASTVKQGYDGIMVSAKDVEEALSNVITPAKKGKKDINVYALRWSIYAKTEEEAWQAIQSQRGLRAPSRGEAIDPKQLQDEVDTMPHSETLTRYEVVGNKEDYINTYAPLISELKANVVGIQTAALDPITTIKMLGDEILPNLRKLR